MSSYGSRHFSSKNPHHERAIKINKWISSNIEFLPLKDHCEKFRY